MPMNLIVLCPDEMRGDCAGFMGNPDIRTPNLDRLAARGLVLGRHMATFPKCVPSRASLMTGRYCHTDGWRSVSQTLAPGQPDLLARLRELGYQTAVFGKNHCWDPERWDGLDFRSDRPPMDRFLEGREPHTFFDPEPGGRRPLELDAGWDYFGCNTRHMRDEGYAGQAVEFLTRARDPKRPFFMQLNIESPHPKYGVEEPWFSMYDRDAIRAWPHALPRNAPAPVRCQREVRTGLQDDETAAREVQAVYYGMISKVDHLIGQVLEAIDREGLWEDTLVLFWSDHGDYAGQYGLPEKWDTHFADCLLHVPCVLCAPDLAPGRYEGLSDHADLAPTLCELLGVDPLPGMHGESLTPMFRGERRKEAVFADGGHEPEMRRRFSAGNRPVGRDGEKLGKTETYWRFPESMARAKMVRTERYKLVVRTEGGNELYDLQEDPLEMNNRWGDPALAGVLPDLLQRLVEWSLHTDPDAPYLDRFTV